MSIQNEKIIVFDDAGNPKELRYYEHEKLVIRLGTILDADNNFIGLRELSVEEVSPQSWFDKNILRKQPQKHVDILTIDFIGLINWINTIKKIITIENVDLIKLISSILNIDLIKCIRSAYIEGIGNIIRNPRFDDDTTYWTTSNAARIAGGFYSDYALRLGNGADSAYAYQFLQPFLGLILEGGLWYKSATSDVAEAVIYISYTDGANTSFTLNGTGSSWTFLNITGLSATKKVKYILLQINAPYTMDITNINISPYFASEATLAALSAKVTACNTGAVVISTLPALVASNVALGLGESATYATIRIDTATSGQATLLAAQGAGIKIHVCGYQLQAKGDVEVSLRSASTDISPEWDLNAREGAVCSPVPKPLDYFATVANELLSINLDAAIRVTGNIQYWLGA